MTDLKLSQRFAIAHIARTANPPAGISAITARELSRLGLVKITSDHGGAMAAVRLTAAGEIVAELLAEPDAYPALRALAVEYRDENARLRAHELDTLAELEGLLYPERFPPGSPRHNPEHGFWLSGGESDGEPYYQWSPDTLDIIAAWLDGVLGTRS